MKTINKIKEYIENEILYNKALLFDDDWGTGKSSLIKNLLSTHDNEPIKKIESYLIINANEIDEKTNLRKILFSDSKKIHTNNLSLLDNDFINNSNFIKNIHDPAKKILGNIVKAVDGYIGNKTGVESLIADSISAIGITSETLLKNYSFEKYLLVIDEVDRLSNIEKLKDIYSKIIELQENTEIRIIVIMNSKKVEINTHEEWKDKIYSATIRMEQNEYFDKIKPTNWNEMEKFIKRITPNYKNLRILERYLAIEKHIEDIVTKYSQGNLNKYQEQYISMEKMGLMEDVYIYYNREDYESYLKKCKIRGENFSTRIVNINKIFNMDINFLDERIKYILDFYNDEYLRLEEDSNYFFHNFIHNEQNINKSKKTKAFTFVKDKLFKDNFNLLSLTHKQNGIKEKSMIFYICMLKEDFKISIKQENDLVKILLNKIKLIVSDAKKDSIEDLFSKFDNNKYDYIFLKKINCLSPKNQYKILKILEKNISYSFKKILYFYDHNFNKNIKEFHYKYNFNIIDDIYNNLQSSYLMLDDLRDLKGYSEANYLIKRKLYYSNLKRPKITKDEINKV